MNASLRRLGAVRAAGLVILGSLAILPGQGAAAATPAAGAPTRLGVTGEEYSLILSRAKLDPGDSIVQFQNGGEDPHDLVWKPLRGGGAMRSIGVVGPGDNASLATRFKPGVKYRFWCTLADHRELGMKATLEIRGPRR